MGSEKSLCFIPGKYPLLKQDQFSSSPCQRCSSTTKNWGSDADGGPRTPPAPRGAVLCHSCHRRHGKRQRQRWPRYGALQLLCQPETAAGHPGARQGSSAPSPPSSLRCPASCTPCAKNLGCSTEYSGFQPNNTRLGNCYNLTKKESFQWNFSSL